MAGVERRAKPLKAKSTIGDITGITISGQATGDILVSNSANEWLNTQVLTGTYTITAATIAALTATAATISNDLTVGNDASITGNTSVGGTLGVTGAATLSSTLALTGAATFSDTLTLAGTLTGAGFSMSGSGTIAQNLTVTGTATIGTIALTDLTLTGFASVGTFLSVGGVAIFNDDVTINANLSAGAIAGSNLNCSGDISGAGSLAIDKISWSASSNDVTALLTGAAGTYTVSGVQTDLTVQAMLLLDPDAHHTLGGVDGLVIPLGTTAQEPTGANGMLRYDSTTHAFRGYVNGAWADLGGGGVAALNDLSDVTLTTPATGSVLYKSASDWINTPAITIDPAGSVDLYYNGTKVFATASLGIRVLDKTAARPRITLEDNSATVLQFIEVEANGNLALNSAVANKGVWGYYNGALNFATGVSGKFRLFGDAAGADDSHVQLNNSGGVEVGVMGFANGNASMVFDNTNGASSVIGLRVTDGGSVLDNGIVIFGAGSVDLYYNGVVALKTISGSIQFGTHTGLGAETVTGYITINDSGGTARKLAVVS